MPLQIPGLSTLIGRIGADVEDNLDGSDAGLRRTPEGRFARALGAAVRGAYSRVAYFGKQILPTTADSIHLPRHGELRSVDRIQPAKASGAVSGTGTAGTDLDAETELEAADGTVLVTDSLATVDGGGLLTAVAVTAKETGAAGNLAAGTVVSLVSPVPGIDTDFTVDDSGGGDGTTGGLDLEDLEDYRDRVIQRWRKPAKGGGSGDYEAWAKEIGGVTRAWAQALALGPGTVRVLFVRDDDTPSIIPSASEVQEVQDHLQETDGSGAIIGGKAPIPIGVTVVAPMAVDLDVTVDVKKDPDSGLADATVESNIADELEDMLLEHAEPGGTIRVSQIREAISRAQGEKYHDLTAPASDTTYAATELPILGTLTVNFL